MASLGAEYDPVSKKKRFQISSLNTLEKVQETQPEVSKKKE
jgi:hypothetical protein